MQGSQREAQESAGAVGSQLHSLLGGGGGAEPHCFDPLKQLPVNQQPDWSIVLSHHEGPILLH